MAKSTKRPEVSLLFMPDVERELAPILTSNYTAQVFLDLSPREQKFITHGLFFYRTAKVERHDSIMGCIRFYPYPYDDRKRFQMEAFRSSKTPLWEEDADTVEEAMKAMDAALKRLVADERAARRAQKAERLAEYDRRQAEAAA